MYILTNFFDYFLLSQLYKPLTITIALCDSALQSLNKGAKCGRIGLLIFKNIFSIICLSHNFLSFIHTYNTIVGNFFLLQWDNI